MERTPEKTDYPISVMRRQIEHLSILVEDLLTLSRLDRDVTDSTIEPVNLRALVRQIVEGQKLFADQKNIGMGLQLPEKLPIIQADSHQLQRVLTNLVANALNYTLEGRGGYPDGTGR